MIPPLTRDEAVDFFATFYRGEHHIPAGKYRGARGVTECGTGWSVIDDTGELSTFDFDALTRLVFLAHDRRYRVGIQPAMRHIRIAVWRRAESGSMSQRHPNLDEAIALWRRGRA